MAGGLELDGLEAHSKPKPFCDSMLCLGRREGWGEGVFKFWFSFSLSYSDLIGNKTNSASQVCFAHDSNW